MIPYLEKNNIFNKIKKILDSVFFFLFLFLLLQYYLL